MKPKTKVESKSILLPLALSSTPLVWVVTTEEYRMLKKEQSTLLNQKAASQVFRYDALDILKEALITKSDGTTEGGRSAQFNHCLEAINWFSRRNPEPDTPGAMSSLTAQFGSDANYAPAGSILVLFDVPARIEHKNGSKWTDALINRTIKNAVGDLIDEQKMIVLVSHTLDVPQELEHIAVVVEHSLPTYEELSHLVKKAWKYLGDENEDGSIQAMPAISEEDLELTVNLISGMREWEADNILARSVYTNKTNHQKDPTIPKTFDIPTIRKEKIKSIRKNSSLEIIEPPGSLDQVGGLAEIKAWAEEAKDLFGKVAAGDGIKCPKGIVLFGPGGTGKTYTISCLGSFLQRTVLRWDVGASKGRYVGQTEEQTRNVFRDAKAQAPCILFIDEAGKLFADAKGAGSGLDGGVNQGMYASLLTFMQENDGGVLIAMACNEDIMNFPAPALRAGRIDDVFFVDLPTQEEVKDILRIHIKKRGWDPASPEIDIEKVAILLAEYTPSEIEQVINKALIHKFKTSGPRPAELKTENLLAAISKVIPMTRTNKLEVDSLRAWAVERGYTVGTAQPKAIVRKAAGRRIGGSLSAIADESDEM